MGEQPTLHERREIYRQQAMYAMLALIVLGGYSLVPYINDDELEPRTFILGAMLFINAALLIFCLLMWSAVARGFSVLAPVYSLIPAVINLITWYMSPSALKLWSPFLITVLALASIAAFTRCYLFESKHDFTIRPEDGGIELFDSDAGTMIGDGDEGDSRKPDDEERLLGGRS